MEPTSVNPILAHSDQSAFEETERKLTSLELRLAELKIAVQKYFPLTPPTPPQLDPSRFSSNVAESSSPNPQSEEPKKLKAEQILHQTNILPLSDSQLVAFAKKLSNGAKLTGSLIGQHPRWLQLFLAHRSGCLEDKTYLRTLCKEMTAEETSKALDFLKHYEPYPFELIPVLVDPSLKIQPPFVQKLILKSLAHSYRSLSLSQEVWDSLDVTEVSDYPTRFQLLDLLSCPACQIALLAWKDFEVNILEMSSKSFLIKILWAEQNIKKQRFLFYTLLLFEFAEADFHNSKINNAVIELFKKFEEIPWRLRAILYRIKDFDVAEEINNKIPQFTEVCNLFNRHQEVVSQKTNLKAKLVTKEGNHRSLLSRPDWGDVYEQRATPNVTDFILAFVKNAEPSVIALHLENDLLMMFFAVFDEKARANLIQAKGTSPAFATLRMVAQAILESPHLPDEAMQQAARFIVDLDQSVSTHS